MTSLSDNRSEAPFGGVSSATMQSSQMSANGTRSIRPKKSRSGARAGAASALAAADIGVGSKRLLDDEDDREQAEAGPSNFADLLADAAAAMFGDILSANASAYAPPSTCYAHASGFGSSETIVNSSSRAAGQAVDVGGDYNYVRVDEQHDDAEAAAAAAADMFAVSVGASSSSSSSVRVQIPSLSARIDGAASSSSSHRIAVGSASSSSEAEAFDVLHSDRTALSDHGPALDTVNVRVPSEAPMSERPQVSASKKKARKSPPAAAASSSTSSSSSPPTCEGGSSSSVVIPDRTAAPVPAPNPNPRPSPNSNANPRSRFRGVSWERGKWLARVYKDGSNIPVRIGRYVNDVDAAHAYDDALVRLCGDIRKDVLSKLNFPHKQPGYVPASGGEGADSSNGNHAGSGAAVGSPATTDVAAASSSGNSSSAGTSTTSPSSTSPSSSSLTHAGKSGANSSTKVTSQYRGVNWEFSRWRVRASDKGKRILVGWADNEEAAARMYDAAVVRIQGHNAKAHMLNFPDTLKQLQTAVVGFVEAAAEPWSVDV